MSRRESQAAAVVLRTLLRAVDEGVVFARGPDAARLLRRLEGATTALELAAGAESRAASVPSASA